MLRLEWAELAKRSQVTNKWICFAASHSPAPTHHQHQLALMLWNSQEPELLWSALGTQVAQDSCPGSTGLCWQRPFGGLLKETCLELLSERISTRSPASHFPAPAVWQTPLPFHTPFGCCQKQESFLTGKPLKATACICVLFTQSLLQRKDLLRIFSSRSGPPGDDSSIAMLSCLLTDSVSTFPLQILEDLISTL